MRKLTLVFLVFLMVLTVGCASASPTSSSSSSSPSSATNYPAATGESPTVAANPTVEGYPAAGNPASGAPALEAQSNIKAELIEQSPDPENPDQVVMRVTLLTVSPVEGSPDRLTPLLGQEITLHVNKQGLPTLSPGDAFLADVVFRGDEKNTYYLAANLQK
jgi:hypothetical protein